MSEQQEKQKGYMVELDLWSEENILHPLFGTDPNQNDWSAVEAEVKLAIRDKVLESYKNGLRAGAGQVRREFRVMPAKNRQATTRGVQR